MRHSELNVKPFVKSWLLTAFLCGLLPFSAAELAFKRLPWLREA